MSEPLLVEPSAEKNARPRERRAIAVSGIVQGVGFRPFVYRLASGLSLGGFVRNQTSGVWIEVEGEGPALDRFLDELARKAPPLARIEELRWEPRATRGESRFRIESSQVAPSAGVFISPDVAPCTSCLRELFDPHDRRYLYPFLNCTECGPRLTIVRGAPYDRDRTTMHSFSMCGPCRAEYEDPGDRRFHAQPTACPTCGPKLALRDREGRLVPAPDPLRAFVEAIRNGRIGALKGLGGYHLACDARSDETVSELRRRKRRDEKPLALMVGDLAAAEAICQVGSAERDLLLSPRRPIVLLRRRAGCGIAEKVAPANPYLGVMLPYTPLHHLLFHQWPGASLVMTSGNLSDEPIAYDDADALERLRAIADFFLLHDRPIQLRCDDSVTRVLAGRELPLRRSRGYAPEPVSLPFSCPRPILALGGQLKTTFALARGRHAFLSQHLGDLDDFEAYRAFVRDLDLYQELFEIRPEILAHDLHPDYATTRYARERGTGGVVRHAVQHHHAHLASCMADNLLTEPVIGVTFDGTGYGSDGAIWGGEFMVGDYLSFERAAHLRYVRLPGGERAIREPWRMAVAYLEAAGEEPGELAERLDPTALATVRKMIARGLNAPWTSSAGRLFDAVAALTGVRERVTYEGQAAMELEWLATDRPPEEGYRFECLEPKDSTAPLVVDTLPLIRGIVRDRAAGVERWRLARRFHTTVAEIIARVCGRLRERYGLEAVVLSGGCFMNALLTEDALARLTARGFRVYRHRRVPPNDGGLSLGQLAVAAAQQREKRGESDVPGHSG
jgi:hydrogenase maturation protein HypF